MSSENGIGKLFCFVVDPSLWCQQKYSTVTRVCVLRGVPTRSWFLVHL